MKPNLDLRDNKIVTVIEEAYVNSPNGIRFYEINKILPDIPMATLRSRILRLERNHHIGVYRELNVLRCYPPGKQPIEKNNNNNNC